METISLKALSIRRIQGNQQGNSKETVVTNKETLLETTQFDQIEPRAMIKEMIADLNRHHWPEGIFSKGMPDYSEIDAAVLAGNMPRLRAAIGSFKRDALNLIKPSPK